MTILASPIFGGGAPPLDPFEPSGTWFGKEDGDVLFSRDGKNWASAPAGGGVTQSPYQQDLIGTDVIFLGTPGSQIRKLLNVTVPNFEGAVGGDGPGACQWIAVGPGSACVARTTTQLRTSTGGILWTDNDASAPANWSDIGSGAFRYSSTAGLYCSMGTTFNATGSKDQYWTSANRTTWTQRTFPEVWPGQGQTTIDFFEDNGSIVVMALSNGNTYTSTDLINWTLRDTNAFGTAGLCWNPILGAFYSVHQAIADVDHLRRSVDGITWASVAGNDLQAVIAQGQIACDPVTGLMWINTTANSVQYQGADCGVSLNGVNWFPRYAMGGRWYQHVPGKWGPLIDDTITITPASINIFDAQGTPTQSFARLIPRGDGTIDQQTVAGIVQIGKWPTGAEDSLNPAGREYRLDQLTGDALNFGQTDVNTWVPANSQRLWGYTTTFGTLSGTFTFRVRDRITLVEDTNGGVPVTIACEST